MVGGERPLIALERQHVVAALLDDLPGDLALGPHRIDRDGRAAQLQDLQHLRDGRDLVGMVRDRLLSQHEAVSLGPRTDHVQRRLAVGVVVGAAQGFAVDRDQGALALADGGGHPLAEAGLEGERVQSSNDPPERVIGGNPMRQGQMPAQPRSFGMAEGLKLAPAFGPSDRASDGDEEDLGERVKLRAVDAWIVESFEVVQQQSRSRFHGRLLHRKERQKR